MGLIVCSLLCLPDWSYPAGDGNGHGGRKKKGHSLKSPLEKPIDATIPSDEHLLDVYTRLMRYQAAAQDYYNYSTGTPTSPEQYLEVGIRDMGFEGKKNIHAEVNAVVSQKLAETLYLVRGELCHDEDVCHVMYEADWAPNPGSSGKKAKGPSKSLAPDLDNVVEYTTYDVAIKYRDREMVYKAIVLYRRDAAGNVTADIVDPGIPLMNTVAADIMPAVKSPWESYIYSGLYWQIANEVRERRANGEPLIPEDAPIGYLPGDDQKEVKMMLMAAAADPCTPEAQCNPSGNSVTSKKIDMISMAYNAALTKANEIKASLPGTLNINAGSLATLFVQWSANESGWGKDAANIAQNNYFGIQNAANTSGLWGGATVACQRNGNPIPTNSQNACFSASVTWGQQLEIALSITPSTTGISYLNALKTALGNNATMAQAMQAIANNGWNANPNYGSYVAGQLVVQPTIDCMKQNGFVQ
jgi:hypothetical protein